MRGVIEMLVASCKRIGFFYERLVRSEGLKTPLKKVSCDRCSYCASSVGKKRSGIVQW